MEEEMHTDMQEGIQIDRETGRGLHKELDRKRCRREADIQARTQQALDRQEGTHSAGRHSDRPGRKRKNISPSIMVKSLLINTSINNCRISK